MTVPKKKRTTPVPRKPRRPAAALAAAPASSATPRPRYVVGIGASAGGLEALRALFSELKPIRHLAFVIVQHLAPQHRSRMVELIGHATPLKVKELEDGERLQPGVVYVTPPNRDAVAEDGTVRLLEPESRIGPKPSVDRFFRSLAEEYREAGIAIVLSGTGSDGSRGIRDVKAAGGSTFSQSVESSKYDGMPRAAKQTGSVDRDLTPGEIAARLQQLDELADSAPETFPGNIEDIGEAGDPLRAILDTLRRVTRVDFSRYKPSTLRRRIERRVVATRCRNLPEYAQRLAESSEEARLLFQDILISVTAFFRDPASFTVLGEQLLDRLRHRAPDRNPLRIWVVGCATGEEAYSIAILASEALEASGKGLQLQIFATDLDEQAMAIARKGVYPRSSVAEVDPALHAKYFDAVDAQNVRVKDFLREWIVFARHDVALDPPFLKLDLVSCRNVLIYFNSRLQEQVLRTFHYALDSAGILFLGKSETTGATDSHFEAADKNARLFLRAGRRGDLPGPHSRTEISREARLQSHDRESTPGIDLYHSMVAAFAPDSVLVDEGGRVRHIHGEASRFLNLPAGAATVALARLLPESMGMDLSAALVRARKSQRMTHGSHKHLIGTETVQLCIAPLSHDGRRDFLVSFQAVAPEARRRAATDRRFAQLSDPAKVRRLQEELAATRDHLQTVIEEHETTNEELQALNEEMQSANEELQSTNEELETTNEELQSANEELTTLNQEVNVKAQELQALNQRLQAIQAALFYPLIVVDRQLHLVEYNPAARFLFRLTEVDRGQAIGRVIEQPEMRPALRLTEESLAKGRDGKLQFLSQGHHYETRVQIVRGPRDEIDGAVMMLVDNTELTQALQQSRLHQQRLDAILDNTPAIVTMKDTQGTYLYANRRFGEYLGANGSGVAGKTDEDLLPAAVAERMREQDYEVVKKRRPMRFDDSLEIGGRTVHWTSSKFALLDERRKVQSVCTIALDITERVNFERQLMIFRQVVSAATRGIVLFEERAGELFATHVSAGITCPPGSTAATLEGLPARAVVAALLRSTGEGHVDRLVRSLRHMEPQSIEISDGDAGAEHWTEVRTAGLDLGAGHGRFAVLTLFDITEQHRLRQEIETQEEEFTRLSKLAALGEVAAGLSHELNTPLNVISAKTGLLERLADRERLDAARLRKACDDIERTVRGISEIISGLKALSGLGSADRHPNDLVPLIREACRTCEFKLRRYGVALHLDLPAAPVVVECIGVQVVQVLINLITNSIEAVSGLSDRWIRVSLTPVDDQARILVTDSGPGIDPHLAEKIMTPFFTTRKDQKGTGLGLSLSRTIARRHGGDLRLVPGLRNTRFQFDLPLRAAEPALRAQGAS